MSGLSGSYFFVIGPCLFKPCKKYSWKNQCYCFYVVSVFNNFDLLLGNVRFYHGNHKPMENRKAGFKNWRFFGNSLLDLILKKCNPNIRWEQEKFWTHEIPTRKHLWHIKYSREKFSDPRWHYGTRPTDFSTL